MATKTQKKRIADARQGIKSAEPVTQAAEAVMALERLSGKVMDWERVTALTSAKEFEISGDLLIELKRQLTAADAERKQIVSPLNGVVKHVNAKFSAYTRPREKLERHLRNLRSDYLRAAQAAAALEAEKEAIKAEKLGAEQLAADIRDRAATEIPVVLPDGIRTRRVWKWRVTDLSKVPRAYMVVDAERLNNEAGPGASVPGVEFYQTIIEAVLSK